MSTLSQFFSGGASAILTHAIIGISRTYVVPATGKYVAIVLGAGGSGALAYNPGSASASGGSAGGLGVKLLSLTAGASLTAIIGGRGAPRSASAQNGAAGGATALVGSGFSTVFAYGGAGGLYAASAGVAGVAGGRILNCDFGFTGGSSGSCSWTNGGGAATGGGAVNIGYNTVSGNATVVSSSTYAASGGAGMGGSSGNVVLTGSSQKGASGGGGTHPVYGTSGQVIGGATSVGGLPMCTNDSVYYPPWLMFPGIAVGAGGDGMSTATITPGGIGAGSGGVAYNGARAGGGGGLSASKANDAASAGNGGLGAGGGGDTDYSYSGAGGNGLIIIYRIA